jgi:SHS2 domain-containing protein
MPPPSWQPFEETPHTADLALIARGRSLRELILNACRGTIELTIDTAGLAPEEWIPIAATGADPERLLLGMVKQILYEWETQGGLPVAVAIDAAPDDAWLESPASPAEARGRLGLAHPADLDDRVRAVPKAATYHNLAVRRVADHLEVTLVLDL